MSVKRSQIVFRGQHLVFHGGEGCWEFVSRRKAAQGVTIVALTPQERLLLVEQFRAPVGKAVIELPAGLVGDKTNADNSVIEAVKRELREETGYECKKVTILCTGSALPGLSDELNSLCLAEELRPIEKAAETPVPSEKAIVRPEERGLREEGERITVHEVPISRVTSWLRKKASEGKVIDLKVYAGLFFLLECKSTSEKQF